MKLPPGITGFFDEHAAFQPMDLKKFRSICYDVSIQKGVTLLAIVEASYPTNYLCAKFSINDQPFQIVMNAYYPLFATTIIAEEGHLTFCDIPQELTKFEEHYQLLSTEELMKHLTEQDIENLTDVEKYQIQLWSPSNIGEAIFNTWD